MKRTLIILFGICIVFVCLWFFNQEDQSSSKAGRTDNQSAVKVITQPIEMTSNDRIFRSIGTGRAELSVNISPSVSDEVTEVLFKAQQEVKKGDILVRLDDREEQFALKSAQVDADDAQSLLKRYNQAAQQGAVPESEVDAAQATYDSAKVAMDQAKLAIEERTIIAPFDGVVGIPNVDPGDRVTPDTLITGLDARNILYVDFEIPEALAGALNNNGERQEITATTPAYPDKEFTGYISANESRINAERRTMLTRALIENPKDELRPGMSFETVWNIKGKDYPTVPEISVQWGRDGSYIWVVREGKSIRIPVTVISRKAGRVLLDSEEIRENENVVIEGLQRLRPEQNVEVIGTSQ